jgi:hypothetical protein
LLAAVLGLLAENTDMVMIGPIDEETGEEDGSRVGSHFIHWDEGEEMSCPRDGEVKMGWLEWHFLGRCGPL